MQSETEEIGARRIEAIIRYSLELNWARALEKSWNGGVFDPIIIKLPRREGHTTVLAKLAKEMGDQAMVVTNSQDQAHYMLKNHGVECFTISQRPPRGLRMPKVVFIDNAWYCSQHDLREWAGAFPSSQFVLLG